MSLKVVPSVDTDTRLHVQYQSTQGCSTKAVLQ